MKNTTIILICFVGFQTSFAQNDSTSINDSLAFPKINIEKSHGKIYEWKNEYNVFIANALDSYGQTLLDENKLPKEQIEKLCPTFFGSSTNNKKIFWAIFFAGMAKYESGFNPNTVYHEPMPLDIDSEGLLQLSYPDGKHYKNCPIDKAKQNIRDPKVNLECSVAIMVKQLEKKRVLFTEKSFYWSVLTKRQAEITSFFQKYSQTICK
jgi:hypothetical protein